MPEVFNIDRDISIPRALAGPDLTSSGEPLQWIISIPRALAGPDDILVLVHIFVKHFNPQGPRRPRPWEVYTEGTGIVFQSPGPSQAPTVIRTGVIPDCIISIPRALAGPDDSLDMLER